MNLWVAATEEAKIGGSIHTLSLWEKNQRPALWWHIMVWAWIFSSVFCPILAARVEY